VSVLTGLSDADLAVQSDAFERLAAEGATPHEVAEAVLRWGVREFGDRMCLTASMTDAVLLHLTHRVQLAVEVVFVDTGYHFEETWDTVAEVVRRYRPALRIVSSGKPLDDRWRTDPDGCCAARKVAPLEAVLADRDAWIAGVRRADGASRAATPYVSRDHRGLVKLAPLAGWSDEYIDGYIERYDVPVNPLLAKGYPSIGCWPCTRQAVDSDPRSGRWAGLEKTECGLHLPPLERFS
jgi:phosphoadenosine phosphosulfate reductase